MLLIYLNYNLSKHLFSLVSSTIQESVLSSQRLAQCLAPTEMSEQRVEGWAPGHSAEEGRQQDCHYCCTGCALHNSLVQMAFWRVLRVGSSPQRHRSVARVMENLAWP